VFQLRPPGKLNATEKLETEMKATKLKSEINYAEKWSGSSGGDGV
jgi:hypothetical protein